MLTSMRWLRKEWRRNHRHHGGAPALARCAAGSLRLSFMPQVTGLPSSRLVEAVTFSVVPGMTALWSICMEMALGDPSARILVGDCSGGFKPIQNSGRTEVFPLLNALHGVKLDHFLAKVCRAEFVIISDDDVFWLDSSAWDWALDQFRINERTSVVSLIPRSNVSSVLRDKLANPMGSHCLILRRETWLREKLSFQVKFPPKILSYDWFYDTGDFANVQLLERGFNIVIAPPEIRQGFMVFDGVSTWTLKIQENAGRIREHIGEDTMHRPEKALRAVYALRGMSQIINQNHSLGRTHNLVPPQYLQTAEQVCKDFVSLERQLQIRDRVESQLANLATRIGNIL